MEDRKYIPCGKCKNFGYCIEDGSCRYNTPERPCIDAEHVDEEV